MVDFKKLLFSIGYTKCFFKSVISIAEVCLNNKTNSSLGTLNSFSKVKTISTQIYAEA